MLKQRWQRLHSWQKFWLMFATFFLVSICAVIIAAWPKADPAIVANLQSPACSSWRALPDGSWPDTYPVESDPCRALRLFALEQKTPLHTEADYEAYLMQAGIRTTLSFLAVWAGFFTAVYLIGWSTAKASGWVLRKRSQRSAS